ncbi:uncharacterized protein LOC134832601 [Culicoides brevitarsis]|uniref:uncharacterized protein LOC134832601 n=1 Tax=Culicoides brevitarsis TaxID=469753 RepID=UPI00307B4C27
MIRAIFCLLSLYFLQVSGTFIRCGGSSSHRRLTFSNPKKIPESCVYKFKPTSSKVCMIKLEFNKFSLAQPTIEPFPSCVVDKMTADGISLCGENPGEHIYLSYPDTKSRSITVTFNTMNREGVDLKAPEWNIKMTQIDCNDKDLPPTHCLQYFTARQGVIESFNYQYGIGPYLGNTSYSICIKKPEAKSIIQISSTFFEMSYAEDDFNGTDTDCLSPVPEPSQSEDFLQIPGSELSNGFRVERFCGRSLMANAITSKTTGPFVMTFNSDTLYDEDKPESGFSLFYEVL